MMPVWVDSQTGNGLDTLQGLRLEPITHAKTYVVTTSNCKEYLSSVCLNQWEAGRISLILETQLDKFDLLFYCADGSVYLHNSIEMLSKPATRDEINAIRESNDLLSLLPVQIQDEPPLFQK